MDRSPDLQDGTSKPDQVILLQELLELGSEGRCPRFPARDPDRFSPDSSLLGVFSSTVSP